MAKIKKAQVKILYDASLDALENQVNSFLASLTDDTAVVSIFYESSTAAYSPSVMIVYRTLI